MSLWNSGLDRDSLVSWWGQSSHMTGTVKSEFSSCDWIVQSWGHKTKPFYQGDQLFLGLILTWNYLPLAGRSPQREEKARRDAVSAPSHAQGTASVIMTFICTLLYCKNECHDIQKKKILTSLFNDHIQKLNQPTGITYVVNYNSSNAHLWALASTFLLAWLEKKRWISVCAYTIPSYWARLFWSPILNLLCGKRLF